MEAASGWGKPIKKVKDTSANTHVTAPNVPVNNFPTLTPTPVTTTQQTTPAPVTTTTTAAKINTTAEPFVPKTVLMPIQIAARAREGLYLIDDQENNYLTDASKLICDEATISVFSSDGKILAFANPLRIGVFNLADQSGDIYDLPNVLAMCFSPTLAFLITIDKRETKHYITIFEAKTLKKVMDYETVRYKKETWPQLKFVGEDELAFRSLAPGRIDVFDPRQGFKLLKTIETKYFDYFQVSPRIENLLVVCVTLEHTAGYDKNEGRIEVFEYNNLNVTPLTTKILDKAHEVQLFFSPTGQHLLAWAQTFTDKTGQSYYGEHVLLQLDRTKKAFRRVPTYKGPIHDVAWNPNGQNYIAISGFMPANSILYTNDSVPRFEFGQHHRNTIRWTANSMFVCLGGFGNLSGDMDIWDMATLKKVGSCKAHTAVSCIWSPDSRRILTGVLHPRLRVANGYKVFKYTGELLISVDYSSTELYEVIWRPGQYEEAPISPFKTMEAKEEPSKAFKARGATTSNFAAQLKAAKDTHKTTIGRFLNPDEIFGNEANIEVEEVPKKKKRIRKKKDKNNEETKDDDDGADEDEK